MATVVCSQPSVRCNHALFIEWHASDETREADLQEHFHQHLTLDMITVNTYQRQTMVDHWKQWFDMEEVESSDRYTILQSPAKNQV